MMFNRRAVLALAFSFALLGASNAQDTPPAPFGLAWLKSADEIRALGVTLSPIEGGDFGATYSATGLPKALSDLSGAYLSFGFDDQLFRIAALGRENENDDYGTTAKARYYELAASLAKSYTSGAIYEQPSTDSFYGDADNFAYSISENKAHWFRMFSSSEAEIELSVASRHTNTYWRLIYTHHEGEASFEASKKGKEEEAL